MRCKHNLYTIVVNALPCLLGRKHVHLYKRRNFSSTRHIYLVADSFTPVPRLINGIGCNCPNRWSLPCFMVVKTGSPRVAWQVALNEIAARTHNILPVYVTLLIQIAMIRFYSHIKCYCRLPFTTHRIIIITTVVENVGTYIICFSAYHVNEYIPNIVRTYFIISSWRNGLFLLVPNLFR